ncbi:MAG: short-chain dehydrogenase [Sphingobacteriales bacterium 41-5]|nr:MAG: short-chain dehydrogenase [Sphingobacteriales bacterium 41-5]
MIISLKNKNALIGGSSGGLGKAIAVQLAESGANVTLLARNEEKLKQAVLELPAGEGQKHQFLVTDFSDFEGYKKAISEYFKNNAVDILVNNTNGPKAGSVLEKTVEDFQAAFNMLFQTVQFTTSLALKHMQQNKWGRIINLTSRTVKEPVDTLALSNTIRAAVTTWGKTLANAVAKDAITVNNILTGNFDTERLKHLFTMQAESQGKPLEEIYETTTRQIPAQRLGRPEELASVIAFLASEQASYITGASIAVDGGLIKSL